MKSVRASAPLQPYSGKCENTGKFVLLKALLPVCMVYTARGESQVANIAQDKPSAIFVTRLSPKAVYTIQTNWQYIQCFIVFCTY